MGLKSGLLIELVAVLAFLLEQETYYHRYLLIFIDVNQFQIVVKRLWKVLPVRQKPEIMQKLNLKFLNLKTFLTSQQPTLLISESTYATTIRDSKRCRERDFLKKIHSTVENGGKVGFWVYFLISGFSLFFARQPQTVQTSLGERTKVSRSISIVTSWSFLWLGSSRDFQCFSGTWGFSESCLLENWVFWRIKKFQNVLNHHVKTPIRNQSRVK